MKLTTGFVLIVLFVLINCAQEEVEVSQRFSFSVLDGDCKAKDKNAECCVNLRLLFGKKTGCFIFHMDTYSNSTDVTVTYNDETIANFTIGPDSKEVCTRTTIAQLCLIPTKLIFEDDYIKICNVIEARLLDEPLKLDKNLPCLEYKDDKFNLVEQEDKKERNKEKDES